MRWIGGILALAAALAAGWWLLAPDPREGGGSTAETGGVTARPTGGDPFTPPGSVRGPITVKTPDALSAAAQNGARMFAETCAACHGENAAGGENGPPLAHVIYEPNHHGDAAFLMAARNGVRAHHWRFGDMPPVAGLTDLQIGWIVAYVRAVQKANGIE